ncbi:MAG: ATP-binding protein [Elusimicrobia bacterium]|nr:ATP-binding protein [Elusimicrobiota bacterium]
MKILGRDFASLIVRRKQHNSVLILTGPRQTGKTTFCERQLPGLLGQEAASYSFDDVDLREQFSRRSLSILEDVKTPMVVLDEAQKQPAVFEAVKIMVDRQAKGESGHRTFVLTGSSHLMLLKSVRETLAGRAALIQVQPFSLGEVLGVPRTGLLSGIVERMAVEPGALDAWLNAPPESLRFAREAVRRHRRVGGFPRPYAMAEESDALAWLKDYRATYLDRDVADVGRIGDVMGFSKVSKLLCGRTGQLLCVAAVSRESGMAVNTIRRYLDLLQMTFQVTLLEPYHENVGKRLVKAPKLYFLDPGLSRAIMGEAAIAEGAAYENWVFSELKKWAAARHEGAELHFYRTAAGLEVDFIVSVKGVLLPVEAKCGETVSPSDCGNVERFMREHQGSAPLGLVVCRGGEPREVRRNVWAIPDYMLFADPPPVFPT